LVKVVDPCRPSIAGAAVKDSNQNGFIANVAYRFAIGSTVQKKQKVKKKSR
jgi:hypothetical protein